MINIPESHIDQYIEKFRDTNQIDILQEECAELIQALSKYKRSIEEMKRVAISSELEIVARLLSITSDDIQKEVDRKATKFNLKKGEEPIK